MMCHHWDKYGNRASVDSVNAICSADIEKYKETGLISYLTDNPLFGFTRQALNKKNAELLIKFFEIGGFAGLSIHEYLKRANTTEAP